MQKIFASFLLCLGLVPGALAFTHIDPETVLGYPADNGNMDWAMAVSEAQPCQSAESSADWSPDDRYLAPDGTERTREIVLADLECA